MSNAVFPSLAGIAWPVMKAPQWKTVNQQITSGREVRVGLMSYPLYRMALTYDLLRAGTVNGSAFTELQTLMNFYNARGGMLDDFLFDDEADNTVTDSLFGVGDGNTTVFQLTRTLIANGYGEPVTNLNGTPVIKDNGANASNYSISAVGVVTFNSAPAVGHNMTWTGGFYYRCRFDDDSNEFERFMNGRWELKTLKMVGSLGSKI